MTEMLPLFPLSTVLFPGMRLPLHIFEERYRRLVRDLRERPEPREFGVIAIRKGRETGEENVDGVSALHEVGCVAAVRNVAPGEDGRFDLQTVGTQRFRLLSLDQSLPYFQGEIERLPDEPGEPGGERESERAALVVARVQAGFRAYLNALADRGGGVINVSDLPDEPLLLSYVVGAAMIIDLPDRQNLLAAPDAIARLKAERALLAREAAMIKATTSRPAPDFKYEPYSPN
jgi:Lon protease-like protein